MGEWLTRRILAGLSDMSEPHETRREEWSGYRSDERGASRRESEEMLEHVSRSETEVAGVYRRIEDQLRGVGRRLDAAERSQTESNRVMSKAAVEMNIAAREQTQAFDQLGGHVVEISDRLERVERTVGSDALRDAVKALHQGLSRLADQITETANQSATQISALSGNLETLAGRLGQVRKDAQASTQALEGHIAGLDERVRTVEKAAQSNAGSLERALETHRTAAKDNSIDAIARLEESVRRLETRGSDPAIDRRLSGIERALSEIVGRIDHDREEDEREDVEAGLKKLAQRLDASEAAQREALEELRKAAAAKTEPQPAVPSGDRFASDRSVHAADHSVPPFNPLPQFETPPFPEGKPPFAEPAFVPPPVPPPAYDTATGFGAEHPFPAAFAAETPSPTVDSYLSAARRSARAAAQAEAERSAGGFTGFAWNSAKPEPRRSGHSLYLGIGVLALAAIAVIAGVILSHRMAGEAPPNAAIGALFQKKSAPPPIKTLPIETLPAEEPNPPATNQQTAPALQKTDVKPAPVHLLPPQAAAPSSPQIAPRRTAAALPQKTVAAPSAAPQKTAAAPPQRIVAAPPQPAPQNPPVKLAPPPAAPLDHLTALANAGNAKAELIVGLKYLDGVPANDTEAAKWLARSAEAGEPVAQYRMGTLFERGRGVPADTAKADHWYEAAANQGNRKAMHNLAVAYAEGSGAKKDFTEAARWFSRAAMLGLSDSQFNLAVLYERGLGVPQSLLNAYKWYAIAAAQGDSESKARLQTISTQLSADDRAAAQHAADTFKPGNLDAEANVAPTIEQLPRK